MEVYTILWGGINGNVVHFVANASTLEVAMELVRKEERHGEVVWTRGKNNLGYDEYWDGEIKKFGMEFMYRVIRNKVR